MESLGSRYMRGRQRERILKKALFKNILNLFTCVCSLNTFYTSPFRTDISTDSTSMLIKELLHKLPNIFLMEYLSNGLPVSRPNRPSFAPVCIPVHVLGLTDRSQPIRSSTSSANAADVELVSQQAYYVGSRFQMHDLHR